MFEDSESESEADEAPPKEPEPVKPAPRKRSRAPPPDDDSDSDEDRKRQVGPGFRRDEWRADALARSGAGDFGKAGSFVDRMAASFQAPRLVGEDEDAAPRRGAARAPSHWTRESANAAKVRAELLRANPSSGRDGRAAYERPSMHGREMVISVGPSSLPSTCRVTRSRIPSANVKWS